MVDFEGEISVVFGRPCNGVPAETPQAVVRLEVGILAALVRSICRS
jgi:2-keto-4-pentenoate hydratase/2-oxohepta-3-ene-1,7-dioic acid hydratase in catechol pathway